MNENEREEDSSATVASKQSIESQLEQAASAANDLIRPTNSAVDDSWHDLKLHPYYWRVLIWPAVGLSFLAALFLIPIIPRWLPEGIEARYWYLLSWGLVLALLALRVYWAAALIRRVRFGLDEYGYYLQWGVWWRSDTRVPFSRIQYVDVNHGPLERYWGLASLLVHTAGTSSAVVVTSGVPMAVADALRDCLLRVENDDGV